MYSFQIKIALVTKQTNIFVTDQAQKIFFWITLTRTKISSHFVKSYHKLEDSEVTSVGNSTIFLQDQNHQPKKFSISSGYHILLSPLKPAKKVNQNNYIRI